jgi:superfamily II DNA/RNA helicase
MRELSSQIADVYSKLTEFTEIKVSDVTKTGKWEGCQILVATLAILRDRLLARNVIDLTELRIVVIDEVDFFYSDEKNSK